MAHAAGIPEVQSDTGPNPGAKTLVAKNGSTDDYVGIGNYPVRPLDQAVGYATFANGGTHRSGYFVQKVTDAKGNVVYQHKDNGERVMDAKVANDTTLAMEGVASTSGLALFDGRTVAAKTGTVGIQNSGNSSDGWTVGFTPQISVASWVGSDKVEPIYDSNHNSEYGRDLAGSAWKRFLDAYLTGKPAAAMPTTQEIGQPVVVAPTTSAAPSTSASSTAPPTKASTTAPAPPTSASSTAAPSTSAAPSTTPSCGLLGVGCPSSSASKSPTPGPTGTAAGAAGGGTPAPSKSP
jgi:membrane peptidoglycan carboxypeptidase